MTERKIPVETTVHQTHLICDYCGESEDDVDEEMVTYEKVGYPDLHLHEGCVEKGLGDIGPRPEKEPFLWRAYAIPPSLLALEMADTQDRTEPTNMDLAAGWITWFIIQILFVLFLMGSL